MSLYLIIPFYKQHTVPSVKTELKGDQIHFNIKANVVISDKINKNKCLWFNTGFQS